MQFRKVKHDITDQEIPQDLYLSFISLGYTRSEEEENVLLVLKYPLARVILKREGENVCALDYSTFGFQH